MTGRWTIEEIAPAVTAPDPNVLRVDPTKCTGEGMCSYVSPELIDVDRWGYPLLPPELEVGEARAARAAAAACPRRALFLQQRAGRGKNGAAVSS